MKPELLVLLLHPAVGAHVTPLGCITNGQVASTTMREAREMCDAYLIQEPLQQAWVIDLDGRDYCQVLKVHSNKPAEFTQWVPFTAPDMPPFIWAHLLLFT